MTIENLLTVESLISNIIVFIVAVLLTNWWNKRKKTKRSNNNTIRTASFENPIDILRTYRDDTKRFGFAYLEKHTPAIIEKLQQNRQRPSAGIDEETIDEVIATLREFQKQFKRVGNDPNEQEKCKIMVLNYVNTLLIRWKQLSENG
ncbi:hypothetical protein [Enterococcus sp. AZ109]|uniref:hypothetical protein n=1 Tax=Enterococcus sp. AZ109 TaxID=2774634 RepID=UPI003F223804